MGRTERLEQPLQLGKYQLVAKLAEGTLGTVYRAKSHGLEGFEKILCVKVVNPALAQNPEFIELLVGETQRAVSLAHANIAQIYDLGQDDNSGQFYVAGEYVTGFDLRRTQELRRVTANPQSMELSVFIISEVAKGLDYAHRRKDYNFNNLNLVHRHICPQNIMLSFEGEVKVTDFGIGRARDYIPILSAKDRIARLLYAAPEIARGEEGTQQSDIFSLGLVLWELLAGRHPFGSDDVDEVAAAASIGAVPPILEHADVPRQLATCVDSMLVPDPAGRIATAGDVYESLVAFIFGNNLRADARALTFAMQELRRDERKLSPDEATREIGMDEISLTDLRVLEETSDPSLELRPVSVATNAELPSAKLSNKFMGSDRPPLPGTLENFYNSARAGRGKAVLVSGSFGSGKHYLPDRLPDAVGWRGNTRAFSISTTPDDPFTPFGVLGEILLNAMLTPGDPQAALDHLHSIGTDEATLAAFRSVIGLGSDAHQGKVVKHELLSRLAIDVLREACSEGPLVVSIDRVERLDSMSLEVIRNVIGVINDMSLMLVMCTNSSESMRAALDTGNPEALEAVNVVGNPPPSPDEVSLTSQAASMLALLVLSGHRMTQADLGKITGLGQDVIVSALKELTEAGLARLPAPATVVANDDDLRLWVQRSMTASDVEHQAAALARHYTQRAQNAPNPQRWGALLSRLHAYASDRRATLREANGYAHWLQTEGWIRPAIDFYGHAAELIAENRLGAPLSRIDFLLARAGLALELSLVDLCRNSLQPVAALSEAVRNDRGSIRGQLLLGRMALHQDDLSEAHRYFRRAATSARAVNDPDLLAYAMLGLARWHDRYGDPLAAQRMLEGAMNLYHRWGTFRMDLNTRALMLNRAVRMLSRRGLHRRAHQLYEDLVTLADAAPLPLVVCRQEWAEAALQVAAENYGAARDALARADRRAQEHGLIALRLELLRERAVAALSDEDYQDVWSLCTELAELAENHGDLYSGHRARDLLATAQCFLASGTDRDGALSLLQSSLDRALDRDVPKDVYRCHLNLDRALRAVGRDSEAAEHRAAADAIADRLRYHVAA